MQAVGIETGNGLPQQRVPVIFGLGQLFHRGVGIFHGLHQIFPGIGHGLQLREDTRIRDLINPGLGINQDTGNGLDIFKGGYRRLPELIDLPGELVQELVSLIDHGTESEESVKGVFPVGRKSFEKVRSQVLGKPGLQPLNQLRPEGIEKALFQDLEHPVHIPAVILGVEDDFARCPADKIPHTEIKGRIHGVEFGVHIGPDRIPHGGPVAHVLHPGVVIIVG